jgi:alpha-galactosidase
VNLALGGIALEGLSPLVDGAVSADARIERRARGDRIELTVVLPHDGTVGSLGLRLTARGARNYLRNGYTSWDGSFFVDATMPSADPRAGVGHAMTALLPAEGGGTAILGFVRHDRYQSRLRFSPGDALGIDFETLIDQVPHDGEIRSETLVLFAGDAVEPALRQWARIVAAASPLPPRLSERRITGWCSWYNLYASLSEPVLLEHLAAARRFRDETASPFDVFLVDDGFTPEMGDWLDTKPQFPNGMHPILDAARADDLLRRVPLAQA